MDTAYGIAEDLTHDEEDVVGYEGEDCSDREYVGYADDSCGGDDPSSCTDVDDAQNYDDTGDCGSGDRSDSWSCADSTDRGDDRREDGDAECNPLSTVGVNSGDEEDRRSDDAVDTVSTAQPLVALDPDVIAAASAASAGGPTVPFGDGLSGIGAGPTGTSSLPRFDGATSSVLAQAARVGQESIDVVDTMFGEGTFQAGAAQAQANGTTDTIMAIRGIDDPAERFFDTASENIERHRLGEIERAADGSGSGSLSNGL